jgi:hypothetical protein
MEHEPTDPANLYFNSSSNVYNPQMQNMLSQVGAQGLGGPSIAAPDGPGVAGPSGQGGGPSWQKTGNDLQQAWGVSEGYPSATYSDGEGASVALPLGAVAFGIDFLVNFFEDLFSGPNSPPIPRKLMHKRHPLYGEILGIDTGIIATVGSDGPPQFCGDPKNCNKSPLQKAPNPGAQPEYHKAPPPATQKPLGFWVCEGTFAAFTAPAVVGCGAYGYACANGVIPACALAIATCGYEIAGAKACYDQAHGKPFPDLPEPPPGDVPQRGTFGLP